MKKIDLGQTLTILANVGVIVGIAFLAAELNQTNLIARYTAENTRRSQNIALNQSVMEHSETYAKLRADNAELTPSEEVQALMLARQLMNSWQDSEFAYESGLLSEDIFEGNLESISILLDEAPGLATFFEYLLNIYGNENEGSSVAREVAEVLKNRDSN